MARLVIDGADYDFDFDFDIGEARIIKRYAGISLNEIEKHNETDPDLIAAFVHIAYRRRNPELSADEIEARVDRVKLATIDMREEQVDARPPDSQTPENDSNSSSSGESSGPGPDATQVTWNRETSGLPV